MLNDKIVVLASAFLISNSAMCSDFELGIGLGKYDQEYTYEGESESGKDTGYNFNFAYFFDENIGLKASLVSFGKALVAQETYQFSPGDMYIYEDRLEVDVRGLTVGGVLSSNVDAPGLQCRVEGGVFIWQVDATLTTISRSPYGVYEYPDTLDDNGFSPYLRAGLGYLFENKFGAEISGGIYPMEPSFAGLSFDATVTELSVGIYKRF